MRSLQHDRDRALFGDDLRPTSSDAPAAPAAALDPDPHPPPTEGWDAPASSTRGCGARRSTARRWPLSPRATSCAARQSASPTDGATPGPRPSRMSSADTTPRSWSRQAAGRAGEATEESLDRGRAGHPAGHNCHPSRSGRPCHPVGAQRLNTAVSGGYPGCFRCGVAVR